MVDNLVVQADTEDVAHPALLKGGIPLPLTTEGALLHRTRTVTPDEATIMTMDDVLARALTAPHTVTEELLRRR